MLPFSRFLGRFWPDKAGRAAGQPAAPEAQGPAHARCWLPCRRFTAQRWASVRLVALKSQLCITLLPHRTSPCLPPWPGSSSTCCASVDPAPAHIPPPTFSFPSPPAVHPRAAERLAVPAPRGAEQAAAGVLLAGRPDAVPCPDRVQPLLMTGWPVDLSCARRF